MTNDILEDLEEQVCVVLLSPQNVIIFPRIPRCKERIFTAKGITDPPLPGWEKTLSSRRAH